jgi:hypothetical protein
VEHALLFGAVCFDILLETIKPKKSLKFQEKNRPLYDQNAELYDQFLLHYGDKIPQEKLDRVAETVLTRNTLQLLKMLPQATRDILSEAPNCIWDYYYMTFFEAGTCYLPDEELPEVLQSHNRLFEAYKAGLGFVFDFGCLQVGVTMPQVKLDNNVPRGIHCEDGPAVVWGEYKGYWWHNTQVEPDWIEKKNKIDPSLALTWANAEQRRCLAEILGWSSVLDQLEVTILDTQPTPGVEGGIDRLLETTIEGRSERFLECTCGTKRKFCIPVPPTVETTEQAVKWTYNLDVTDVYRPEIRT